MKNEKTRVFETNKNEPEKTYEMLPKIARKGKSYDVKAIVGPNSTHEVSGTVIPINDIAIMDCPVFDLRDRWYKIQNGYISAYRVTGWIKDDKGSWYEMEEHRCPKSTIVTIDGEDYAFDKNGYLITKERLAEDNHIVY